MKIKCPKCEHEWETTSKMLLVTCSCCGYKVKNPEREKEVKNGRRNKNKRN